MKDNLNLYADLAQKSLEYFFKSKKELQYLDNFYPLESEKDNEVFNYWWLAHTVDVKIDAFLRTGIQSDLEMAEKVYNYNKTRNGNTLIHVYYDDMLWNALAAMRLYQLTNKKEYFNDAQEVWQDHVDTGWNDHCGGGFAWRKIQMDYKNSPVNLPFIILSLKLYQITNEMMYLNWAYRTMDWFNKVLLNEDYFVEDGINRLGDGEIDYQWTFTYNQGVYIGACIEFYKVTKDYSFIIKAKKNADISIEKLSKDGIFIDEGNGGDEGLFKGIFYRYFSDLIEITQEDKYKKFIETGVEVLIDNGIKENYLLMGMDWNIPTEGKIPFSAQLSGIMAIEMAAKLK